MEKWIDFSLMINQKVIILKLIMLSSMQQLIVKTQSKPRNHKHCDNKCIQHNQFASSLRKYSQSTTNISDNKQSSLKKSYLKNSIVRTSSSKYIKPFVLQTQQSSHIKPKIHKQIENILIKDTTTIKSNHKKCYSIVQSSQFNVLENNINKLSHMIDKMNKHLQKRQQNQQVAINSPKNQSNIRRCTEKKIFENIPNTVRVNNIQTQCSKPSKNQGWKVVLSSISSKKKKKLNYEMATSQKLKQ